ncbi:MAG: response regulator, partial [Lachnospiraceae bacterium]|nr:response regulator [Lachnospiraceae bacterium]
GQTRISKEADKYNSELTQWMLQQQSILRMFSDVIAADHSVLDDYDYAVKWLDDIAQNYSDMSACYMANPYAEHAVIMNNGWVPEPDYHVEERQWYLETERSGDGYSISAPYFDAQTGLYCITFSRIVYSKEGEFLGIFAIDCYIDKLIDILDDSYRSDGYAFLVDQDGTILNHPDKLYEMTSESSKNIEDTEYADAYHKGSVFGMRDYDGQFVSCCVEKSENSGFTVVVIQNWWSVYGTMLLITLVFLAMLIASIVAVARMISRFINWQEDANEKLVEAAQTAVNAGKAKSRFLAQMSHEIRTPINAVLGMNEMILRESEDDSIREYSENIQSAGRNLLGLINTILDFSKIEEGKMEIIPVKYDTAAMLGNVIHSIDSRAGDKGLIFESHIDENLPSALYGDDMRISQVVSNLLTNAVKYTREGRVDLYVTGQMRNEETLSLQFRVKDTGIGIKAEDQSKLFESFTRLEETRNRNIEGTGLGMAIVSKLLDMMGSKLEMTSEYGKGSEFSFSVDQTIVDQTPIGDLKQRSKASEKQEEAIYAPTAKVLAVDDNEMNLKVIRNLLKLSGIVPDMVDSGDGALEKLRTGHYDLVLLDHMMPGMDGIETLHKAKEEGLIGGATTVIALTANAVVGARESYLEAGFDDYLSKPVEISALERALMKYLPESRIQEKPKPGEKPGNAEKPGTAGQPGEAPKTAISAGSIAPAADLEGDDEIMEFLPEDDKTQGLEEKREFSEVRKDLEALGIKVSDGITYCAGEEDFYQEILLDYANTYEEKRKDLEDALAAKDLATYAIKVHALKGVAKTVGDSEVFEQAKALEMASKEGKEETVASDHPALMKEFERKTQSILKILKP